MAMNLSAFLSAVPGGIQTGQKNAAAIESQQTQNLQQKLALQSQQDDQLVQQMASLTALAAAQQNAPPPQGAGQPSVPSQPPPQPMPPQAPPQPAPIQTGAPPPAQGMAPGQPMPPRPMPAQGQPVAPQGPPQSVMAPGAAPQAPPAPPNNMGGMAPQGAPPRPLASPQAGPPAATAPPSPGAGPQGAPQAPAPQQVQAVQTIQSNLQGTSPQMQQAVRAIMAVPQNRALIQKRPELLIKVLQAQQQLQAPYDQAALKQASLELAQQKVLNQLSEKQATLNQSAASLDERRRNDDLIDRFRQQALQVKSNDDANKLMSALTIAILRDKGQTDRTNTNNDARERRAAENLATKSGVTVGKDDDLDTIQKKTSEAIAKKSASGLLDRPEATFVAKAGLKDPAELAHLLTGRGEVRQANTKQVLDIMGELGASGDDLAAAKVALGGNQAEARTIGTQAGKVALGRKEIDPIADQVLSTMKTLDLSRFPTINALMNYAKQKGGNPDIVKYANYIQGLKNAYTQVLIRGGQNGKDARDRADEVINYNMAPDQIRGAIEAIRKEADIAGAAASGAAADVKRDVSGRGAPAAADSGTEGDLSGKSTGDLLKMIGQ